MRRTLAFALPGLLYFAPLAAAWALPLFTLAILWTAREEGVLAWRRALVEAWMWLPLVIVMAASALWALDGRAAALLALRVTALLAAGALLVGTLPRLAPVVVTELLAALGWGMAAAGLLVAIDLAAGTPAMRALHGSTGLLSPADAYSRGAVFQGILAGPLAIQLWRAGRRRLALAQLAAAALAVLLGIQAAAKLAFFAGLVAGGATLALPALRWLAPAAVVVGSIGLPWALPATLPSDWSCWLAVHKPSALHRLVIWNWVDARIRERPLIGWGLDAARRMPGGSEPVVLRGCTDPPEKPPRLANEVLPLHPHNAALQVWLELGALGVAAALGALGISSIRAFRRWPGRSAAPLAGVIAASAAAAFLSFGIWQEWWIAVLCLAAGVGAAAANADRPQ